MWSRRWICRVWQYAGRDSEAHHPGTLLALLIYGYAAGARASRHSALSHGHALKLKQQLQASI